MLLLNKIIVFLRKKGKVHCSVVLFSFFFLFGDMKYILLIFPESPREKYWRNQVKKKDKQESPTSNLLDWGESDYSFGIIFLLSDLTIDNSSKFLYRIVWLVGWNDFSCIWNSLYLVHVFRLVNILTKPKSC